MSIEVTCQACGSSHHVNERLAGRSVRCPSCENAVAVPELTVETSDVEAVEVEPINVEVVEAEPVNVEPVGIDVASDLSPSPLMATPSMPNAASAGGQFASDDDEDEDDKVLPRGNRPEEEMDMTPMVDVTFLLLIFFMVTAAFSLQKSIMMPRQQTDAPSTAVIEEETEDLDMVELQVDEFGSFLVMAPDWERETPGKQNLISALREAIAANKDGMRLVIKVHEMAKLKALVDAMDAGTIAGYAQLEVTQVDSFD
ncbi:biopolymer transporter ExbD [Rubripirellula amarantea]|nr:biopolymer transporter ExbD [Rubripirellula amarantea]